MARPNATDAAAAETSTVRGRVLAQEFDDDAGLWVEWAATIPGGIVGGLLYDALIYSGSDSPLNKPWEFSDLGRRWRRAPPADRALDEPEAKQNMPAGNAGSKV